MVWLEMLRVIVLQDIGDAVNNLLTTQRSVSRSYTIASNTTPKEV